MSSESLLSQHEDNEEHEESSRTNMEARAEHQKTKHYNSLYSFTTSIGVGLLILVLFWILHYRGGFSWQSSPANEFNWHPFLMTAGMVFFYSQSMLVYRTFRNAPKRRLKLSHAFLHSMAFILTVIGLKAVFDSHNLPEKPIPNLYSLHSWIGLSTAIIFAAQFLLGLISFLYPGLSKIMRQAIMPVHVIFGVSGFVLAIIAVMTGLTEKLSFSVKNYSSLPTEGIVCNFIGIFAALYAVLVLYLVNEKDYKRESLLDDEIALAETE